MATISSTSSARPVSEIIAARILEDADLIAEMLALVPEGAEEWRPRDWPGAAAPFTVAVLRAHLADSLAGVCACLYKLHPGPLAHFEALRTGNPSFTELRTAAAEGFALVSDEELTHPLPAVLARNGQAVAFLELVLINAKHLQHHGYQLFIYLKLLGVPVGTRHLYRFG